MTTGRAVSIAMKREKPVMARFNTLAAATLVAVLATPCVSTPAAETTVKAPALVEATTDAKIKKITLTPKAAERLGILIDEVRADPSGRLIVPYASVFYDLSGRTWVYIS